MKKEIFFADVLSIHISSEVIQGIRFLPNELIKILKAYFILLSLTTYWFINSSLHFEPFMSLLLSKDQKNWFQKINQTLFL